MGAYAPTQLHLGPPLSPNAHMALSGLITGGESVAAPRATYQWLRDYCLLQFFFLRESVADVDGASRDFFFAREFGDFYSTQTAPAESAKRLVTSKPGGWSNQQSVASKVLARFAQR